MKKDELYHPRGCIKNGSRGSAAGGHPFLAGQCCGSAAEDKENSPQKNTKKAKSSINVEWWNDGTVGKASLS